MGLVDEGVTFTERFDGIESQLTGYYADAIEGTQKLSDDIQLIKRALGTMLAGITGQPLDRPTTEALVKELGYAPVSPLLVSAR